MRRVEKLPKLIAMLAADERGATAIEYGLLTSLIAIAAIQALSVVGTELNATFSTVSGKMAGGASESPPAAAADEPPAPAAAKLP